MKKQLLAALLAATATAAIAEETVASSNAIGIMEVSSDKARTIVAVPWTAIGTGNVAIGDLVLTDNLTTGDILYAYDVDTGTYKAWQLNNGAWVSGTSVTLDGASAASESAGAYTVARGSAFWLERQTPTASGSAKTFYLLGQVAEGTATTPFTAGSSSGSKWNLVANPTLAAKTLSVITSPSANDEIIFVAADGKPTKYAWKTVNNVTGWATQVASEGPRPVKRWTLVNESIPVGQGFWYVSTGAAPTINWAL